MGDMGRDNVITICSGVANPDQQRDISRPLRSKAQATLRYGKQVARGCAVPGWPVVPIVCSGRSGRSAFDAWSMKRIVFPGRKWDVKFRIASQRSSWIRLGSCRRVVWWLLVAGTAAARVYRVI